MACYYLFSIIAQALHLVATKNVSAATMKKRADCMPLLF